MDIPLDEQVYFAAVTSDPATGVATDATGDVTFKVFEEATDTAIVSGTMTKRTGETGTYRGTFAMTAANGFEVGKFYHVIIAATVVGIAGKAAALVFRCVSALVDTFATTLAAIKAKTDTITAGQVAVTSAVTDTLDVELVKSDDYRTANSRILTWTNTSGTWCAGDCTDATVTFAATDMDGTIVLSKAGAVTTPTGTQAISVELTAANTTLFTKVGRQYKYQLLLVKSTYRETVAAGDILVTTTLSPPS